MNNLKTGIELMKEIFWADYPIKGGSGKSFKNAIVIDSIAWTRFVELEYEIVNFLSIHIGKLLYVKKQKLRKVDEKYFDILYVEELEPKGDKYTFDLYFDITDCWNKKNKKN
ncbi:MAG: hypothetical protein ACOYLE_06895 [Bacteroidales bacterium]